MKKFNFAFVFLLFPVLSSAVEIRQHYCVNSSLETVKSFFTDYNHYAARPGSNFSVSIVAQDYDLVKMVKSQSKQVTGGSSLDHQLVWIVMQPVAVESSSFYPRFLLDCDLTRVDASQIAQRCFLRKDAKRFGLDEVDIRLNMQSNDQRCRKSQTGIDLAITIEGNRGDIDQIKSQVLGGMGALKPLVSVFFDDELFFKNYFENMYKKWAKLI